MRTTWFSIIKAKKGSKMWQNTSHYCQFDERDCFTIKTELQMQFVSLPEFHNGRNASSQVVSCNSALVMSPKLKKEHRV